MLQAGSSSESRHQPHTHTNTHTVRALGETPSPQVSPRSGGARTRPEVSRSCPQPRSPSHTHLGDAARRDLLQPARALRQVQGPPPRRPPLPIRNNSVGARLWREATRARQLLLELFACAREGSQGRGAVALLLLQLSGLLPGSGSAARVPDAAARPPLRPRLPASSEDSHWPAPAGLSAPPRDWARAPSVLRPRGTGTKRVHCSQGQRRAAAMLPEELQDPRGRIRGARCAAPPSSAAAGLLRTVAVSFWTSFPPLKGRNR